jgi:hypothetical protein
LRWLRAEREGGVVLLDPALVEALGLGDGDGAAGDQLALVDRAHRGVVLDQVVHQRLGEGRVVALVVAELAVADQVDDDVALEALAKAHRQAGDVGGGLDVVAVDVEHGDLQQVGDVGRVDGGAGLPRVGGEADLVVDDDADGAAGAVAAEAGEVEGLLDDALAGEGGVAVDGDAHDAVALGRRWRPACRGRGPG